MFLRFEGAISICRNSLYEFVCNSIRFGGAIGSLILPKLILSFARDAIFYLFTWSTHTRRPFFTKQHKASTPVTGKTCRSNRLNCSAVHHRGEISVKKSKTL